MAIESVKAYFAQFGIADQIREFSVSSATVALAAQALGTQEARIAKSLSFLTKDGPILVVAAGDAKIDNGKYKRQFGEKAKMLPFDAVEPMIGHAVGGVCAFAIRDEVRVYLDASLRRFETVFPACGSANSAIELTLAQMERYSQNFVTWVDVCKGWQPDEA